MLRNLFFWSAFPFVIPQALYVKTKAPRFADAEGGKEGVIRGDKEIKVLGLGDSIIAGVGAGHVDTSWMGQSNRHLHKSSGKGMSWQRIFQTGANISEINQMYLQQNTESYDLILISVGVNDVTGLSSLKHWRKQLQRMIDQLRQDSPQALIVFSGLPPMGVFPLLPQPLRYLLGLRASSLDMALRQITEQHENILHMPIDIDMDPKNFSEDGYHPSAYGCQRWGQATAELIISHPHFVDAQTV